MAEEDTQSNPFIYLVNNLFIYSEITLLDVSTEVLCYIISFCDPDDLLNLYCTCSTCYNILQDDCISIIYIFNNLLILIGISVLEKGIICSF